MTTAGEILFADTNVFLSATDQVVGLAFTR